MTQAQVAIDFDQISAVYDETRDPLDSDTIGGLVAALRRERVSSLLEVGVGTGRVAVPLLESGLVVTGVDLSRGMLSRAQRKGVHRLARGSAYHLPFRPGVFDGSLFVHVLHIMDDPRGALRESARVTREGVWALVHPRGPADAGATDRGQDEAQKVLREVLLEEGVEVPPRRSTPWTKEREILESIPPDSVEVVSEADVTEPLQARLDRLAKRGHRMLLNVSPESLSAAVEVAKRRVRSRAVTYHRVEALAHWGPRG